jgi:hypothetical protein
MVEYDGNAFRVLSDRRVRMVPPQSDPIADYQQQTGFWYSVVDLSGRVLFRRVIPAPPVFTGTEVFTKNPDEHLYRLAAAPITTTLVLVFPDFAEGARLEIFGSRRDPDGRLQPASSLAALPLKETTHGRK